MNDLVTQLADKAHAEQVVASRRMENGTSLLAYPLENGTLVGVGFERDRSHQVPPEAVLRKRSSHPARYGPWLPALFNDGSCYVVRRIGPIDAFAEQPQLTEEDLMAAMELLS